MTCVTHMTLLYITRSKNVQQVPLAGWLEANYHIFREDLDPRNPTICYNMLQRFSKQFLVDLSRIPTSFMQRDGIAGAEIEYLRFTGKFQALLRTRF